MKSQNEYIGDDKFKKMLEHYHCPTPLHVVKMRISGAICSPNMGLRPTDVISSFWPQGKTPRLETKPEAELFFKFFMGLWDEMFHKIKLNEIKLLIIPTTDKDALKVYCRNRYEEVESGYIEGFWGGQEDLKLPRYMAEVIDSLSDLAEAYNKIASQIEASKNLDNIKSALHNTDKMVEKAISFIIENSVLPRIEDIKRSIN